VQSTAERRERRRPALDIARNAFNQTTMLPARDCRSPPRWQHGRLINHTYFNKDYRRQMRFNTIKIGEMKKTHQGPESRAWRTRRGPWPLEGRVAGPPPDTQLEPGGCLRARGNIGPELSEFRDGLTKYHARAPSPDPGRTRPCQSGRFGRSRLEEERTLKDVSHPSRQRARAKKTGRSD